MFRVVKSHPNSRLLAIDGRCQYIPINVDVVGVMPAARQPLSCVLADGTVALKLAKKGPFQISS
jgi:hypothetical protein